MAFLQKKNNAKSLITNNPLTSGGTTINVTGGDGALFPSSGDFKLTIWDKVAFPDPSDDSGMEIVLGTSRSTDAITVTRAQEGTTGVEHTLGEAIEMLITAGTFDDSLDQDVKTTDSPTFADLTLSGDLAVNGGDITSTSGAIAFGNENLSTTGTLASGALTVTGDGIIDGIMGTRAGSTLTIASGEITITNSYHNVSPESGTTDNLDSILGGTQGDILILTCGVGDTITIRDNQAGADSIFTHTTSNVKISGTWDTAFFVKKSSRWELHSVMARSQTHVDTLGILHVTGGVIEDPQNEDLVIRTNSNANQIALDSAGGVGINRAAPTGTILYVDQPSTDDAIPTVTIDQADISEGTINFVANDRGVVNTIGIGSTEPAASVRVELNGTVYVIGLWADQ